MCTTSFRIPIRYLVTFMAFWGFINVYAMRVNLSVALVAMVNQTDRWSNSTDPDCPLSLDSSVARRRTAVGKVYNWSAQTRANILGAFYYGYVLTQLMGGYLAERIGGKWLFGGGIFVTAVFSLATPLAADFGVGAFIIVRVLQGLGEGVTFPSMNAIISRWSPKYERSRMSTIVYTGCQFGNVIAMPICGLLSSSETFGGWSSVFYVFGGLSLIWFAFWCFLICDEPSDHPFITKNEVDHIKDNQDRTDKKAITPWKSILTSVPLWALTLTHFGHSWGFLMLLSELPSFLNLLNFDIESNGALSALPYLIQALTAWLVSYFADRLRRSKLLTNTQIRKLCNSIGLFAPAMCLIAVTMSGCRPLLIVGLITIGMAFNGFTYSGFNATHIDMSPDFAGTLYGITNTVANTCGILAPLVVGAITARADTIRNWNYIFDITAVIYILSGFTYLIFASAELQPWSPPSGNSERVREPDISLTENPKASQPKLLVE